MYHVTSCRGQERGRGAVRAEFAVLPDAYPRRTLQRRLCQSCAITLSI